MSCILFGEFQKKRIYGFLHYAESKERATCIDQTQVNPYQRPVFPKKIFWKKVKI